MSDIQELIESGTGVIKALDEARHTHIAAMRTLAAAELDLALAGAYAENRAIVDVGGIKSLGANESARKRALIIALSEDRDYQGAHAHFILALGKVRLAQAGIDALKDAFSLLKSSLYASASQD